MNNSSVVPMIVSKTVPNSVKDMRKRVFGPAKVGGKALETPKGISLSVKKRRK